jgi:hypothetical protein
VKLRCAEITRELIFKYRDAHWIIGTYTEFDPLLIRVLGEHVRYSTFEWDAAGGRPCNCWRTPNTRAVSCRCHRSRAGTYAKQLWSKADTVYFVTPVQYQRHLAVFPQLLKQKTRVGGTWYTDATLDKIGALHAARKPRDVWAIHGTKHLFKNTVGAIRLCEESGREYELLVDLPHYAFLEKLSTCRGLVFHPLGFESESRISAEAKLLGLELDINDNIPIKNEPWFTGSREDLDAAMRGRIKKFWEMAA